MTPLDVLEQSVASYRTATTDLGRRLALNIVRMATERLVELLDEQEQEDREQAAREDDFERSGKGSLSGLR